MHLVTAVVVNCALENVAQDKEVMKAHDNQKQMSFIRDIRKMFMRIDQDKSGCISKEELLNIVEEEDRDLLYSMTNDDPEDLFDALDVNCTGELSINEFCEGIWQVHIEKAPVELKRVEKHVEYMRKQLESMQDALSYITLHCTQQHIEPKDLQHTIASSSAVSQLPSFQAASQVRSFVAELKDKKDTSLLLRSRRIL